MSQRHTALFFIIPAIITITFSYWYESKVNREEKRQHEVTVKWLKENGLEEYQETLELGGVMKFTDIAELNQDRLTYLSRSWFRTEANKNDKMFLEKAHQLKQQLMFKQWLHDYNFQEYYGQFKELGISSFKSFIELPKGFSLFHLGAKTNNKNIEELQDAHKVLKSKKEMLKVLHYPVGPPTPFYARVAIFLARMVNIIVKVAVVLLMAAIIALAWLCFLFHQLFKKYWPNNARLLTHSTSILSRFCNILTSGLRNKICIQRTSVEWDWEDPSVVGSEKQFRVKFYRNNFMLYKVSELRAVAVEIKVKDEIVNCSIKHAERFIDVELTPTRAGEYKITVSVEGRLTGGPYFKTFLPGPADAEHTTIGNRASYSVVRVYQEEMFEFQMRDKYENLCEISTGALEDFHFTVQKIDESKTHVSPELKYFVLEDDKAMATVKLNSVGCHKLSISFKKKMIKDGEQIFVCLSAKDWSVFSEISRDVDYSRWFTCYLVPFEGTLAPPDTSRTHRKRKVYTYLTPKFLTVKEYFFKIFPKCLYKVKVKPYTKITALRNVDPVSNLPMFMVDSNRERFVLACEKRDLVIACFGYYLRNAVGGSENFENKKQFFHTKIRTQTRKSSEFKTTITVRRSNLLLDSIKVTKHFSNEDWNKCFDIKFYDELGLDFGGPRREWFYLLGELLFDPKNKLFRTFGKNGLVHPNPHRPESLRKLKYYEFAGRIVGKCQLECAQGRSRQQYLRARFSRSFLAQVLGLKVHWKHFETDDKELYVGKIKYILENDPSDLGLTFTDEVFDNDDHLVKVVDLKAFGSVIEVTEENKHEYLELLAEYRLCTAVKEEIAAFVKGLYDVIPEEQFAIFDENELELLICGLTQINISDLQLHHNESGNTVRFQKVLKWLWTILSGFNQEELTRFVQFSTGCGQLPPGGFADLLPRFQIVQSQGFNSLPTAHTCFNALYLPDYLTIDEFRRKLLLAINEGSEGFGLM